jgi:cyclopropane fatty-acyl-phospholipid synthase-like methyltransferase
VSKLFARIRERGVVWTALWYARWRLWHLLRRVDRRAIAVEKRRFITGNSTVSSLYHSMEENRQLWDHYDWSQSGEEWTNDVADYRGLDPAAWKQSLIEEVMKRYVARGSTVLEIGPGAGRWTEHLLAIAGVVHAADISKRCLALCEDRFGARANLRLHWIEDGGLPSIASDSIDCAWSYDVFVHITPNDIDRYLGALRRVLEPGGIAVIHHSGRYKDAADAAKGFRSHMDGDFFAHLVAKHGLELIEQNTELPHKEGDVISVFRKPPGAERRPTVTGG